jgi:hypothetical protein
MTNFNWIVTDLYTETIEGKQDYVVIARYEVIGVDGQYTASTTRVITFSTESVGSFVPYDQLTNEIVVGWIKGELEPSGVENIEASVQGQIDSQINPPTTPQSTPLPWT